MAETDSPVTSRSCILDGRLLLDGRAFVVVGAEIHNSSASTPGAIQRSFTPVRDLGADTVLALVYW